MIGQGRALQGRAVAGLLDRHAGLGGCDPWLPET